MRNKIFRHSAAKIALSLLLMCISLVMLGTAAQAEGLLSEVTVTGATEEKYFSAHPGVYEMGDGYAVIWATSFEGTGYITYTYEGVEYTVYDQRNGIVRTDDEIHVVKVPHEHLADNSYTVHSVEVVSHVGDKIEYGVTLTAGPITLKGYDGGEDLDLVVYTDVHNHLEYVQAVAEHLTDDPDLVIFLGDTAEFIYTYGNMVDNLFNIMGTATGGQYPIVYCRGNHEAMGMTAPELQEYFPTETGEMYYDFEFGPLYGVVLDTGADADDDNSSYGGTVNFEDYNTKQEAWVASIPANTEATYRLAINHIPYIHSLPNNIDMSDSMAHLGFQFAISGHTHHLEYVQAGSYEGIAYPTYMCGGPIEDDNYVGVLMTFSGDTLYTKTVDINGNLVEEYTTALVSEFGSPSEQTEYVGGEGAQVKIRNSNQITVTTAPTVFETGGDFYTVVWVTDRSAVAGIEYEYNGETYQFFDEDSGTRRSFDYIHSVKVPKEHLNGNQYRIICFYMEKHYPYSAVRGKGMYSDYYTFADISSLTDVKISVLPGLKGAGTAADTAADADIYIVNGGAAAKSLDAQEDLITLLNATSAVSGGTNPVVLTRGKAETTGSYATNLAKYIPTASGEFYYSFEVGGQKFINLDTALYSKNMTDGAAEAMEQWINSLPAGEYTVISYDIDSVSDELKDLLISKGMRLHITADGGSFDAEADGVLTVASDADTVITLSGDNAEVKAADFSKSYDLTALEKEKDEYSKASLISRLFWLFRRTIR